MTPLKLRIYRTRTWEPKEHEEGYVLVTHEQLQFCTDQKHWQGVPIIEEEVPPYPTETPDEPVATLIKNTDAKLYLSNLFKK